MMCTGRAQPISWRRGRGRISGGPTDRGWMAAGQGALATALIVGLIGFHAEILWQRLASMTLLQPHVALRWALSVAVLAGMIRLRRAGVSLLNARRALVIWLAVLLIHVPFPLTQAGEPAVESVPDPPVTLLFILPATAALSLVFGVVLALQAAGGSRATVAGAYWPRPRALPSGRSTLAESYPQLHSRPPPA